MSDNMQMKEIIITARTVEEAVAQGKLQLGDDADFEIIEMPAKKLFRTLPAKVRVFIEQAAEEENIEIVIKEEKAAQKRKNQPQPKNISQKSVPDKQGTEKKETQPEEKKQCNAAEKKDSMVFPQPDSPVTEEKDYNAYVKKAIASLQAIFEQMEIKGLTVKVHQGETEAMITVEGKEASYLIGRHGETMSALQYLLSLYVNRKKDDYYRIILNIENYREKREKTLQALAMKIAKTVVKTGRSTTLEPMNPYERRIIHYTVQNIEGAISASIGEEPNRRVVIRSKFAKKRPPYGNAKRPYDKKGQGRYHNNANHYKKNDEPYQKTETPETKEKKSDVAFGTLYGKIDIE